MCTKMMLDLIKSESYIFIDSSSLHKFENKIFDDGWNLKCI